MIVGKLSEADFEALDLSSCDGALVREFLQILNNATLGRKVYEAINQKEKNHFDKALLSISEANRDQVLAIREIQVLLKKGFSKTPGDKLRLISNFYLIITSCIETLDARFGEV